MFFDQHKNKHARFPKRYQRNDRNERSFDRFQSRPLSRSLFYLSRFTKEEELKKKKNLNRNN